MLDGDSLTLRLLKWGLAQVVASDAHSAAAVDCAFDRFAAAETYVDAPT